MKGDFILRMDNTFNKIIKLFFGFIIIYIIFTLLDFSSTITPLYQARSSSPIVFTKIFIVISYFIIGLFLIISKKELYKLKFLKKVKLNFSFKYKKLLFILFVFIHLCLVYSYVFITDWDVGAVLEQAKEFAITNRVTERMSYFSTYPNNVFITVLFSFLFKILNILKIGNSFYIFVVSLTVVLADITFILFCKLVDKIFIHRSIKVFSKTIFFFLIILSPWISIPYSDSIGLIFPVLIVLIYFEFKDNYKKYIILGVLSMIGLKIKPQIFIATIALMIFLVFFEKKSSKKIIILITSLFLTNVAVNLMMKDFNQQLSKEKNIGILHFVNMGLNRRYLGGFNEHDVKKSISIPLKRERDVYNLQSIQERIIQKDPRNLVQHLSFKTAFNYFDSSYYWGREGVFYFQKFKWNQNNVFSKITQSIFYNKGKLFYFYHFITQFLWIFVLCCIPFSIIHKSKKVLLFQIIFIGVFLFASLFEARGRYLFVNIFMMVILSGFGIEALLTNLKSNYLRQSADDVTNKSVT